MKGVRFPERICRLEPIPIASEQCDVLFASYSAVMSIEPRTHDTENWGVVTRGELILDVQGREARLWPGDWYHVPAHAWHCAHFERDTESIEFWFAASERPRDRVEREMNK